MTETRDDVRVGDRLLAMREWESEVMLRAAGWILFLRGAGVVLFGLAACALQPPPEAWRRPTVQAWPLLLPGIEALQVLVALRIFRRAEGVRRWAIPFCLVWEAWLAWTLLPDGLGKGAFFASASDPSAIALAPLLFLPDLFALWALLRRGAREALRGPAAPLAPLATREVRRSGRASVALAMTALAFLSAAILLFLAPGYVLA